MLKVAGVKHFCALIFISCLLLPLPAYAASPLQLVDDISTLAAASHAEFLPDPSRDLTLEQVMSAPLDNKFQPAPNKNLSFGRTLVRQAVWVRFQVVNQSDRQWYLLLNAMLGDEFALFVFRPGDSASTARELTPTFAKPLSSYRHRAWSLDMPLGETLQVYMRATNGDSVLQLPAEFVQADAMLERSTSDYRLLAALYAAASILAIYQLFMAAALRDTSYLWLGLHILAMVATMHRTNPVFPGFEFLGHTGSYFFTTPLLLMITFFMLFARLLLETRRYTPWLDKLFTGIIGLGLVMIATTGAIPGGTTHPLLLGLLVLIVVFITSLRIARKSGSRIVWYFTGMFTFSLMAQSLNILLLIVVPQQWGTYQDLWASGSNLLFVVLMSLIQAERVRMEREERKEIESAGRAKEDFLAVMSHELRTPMHAITSLGTLLKLTPLNEVQQQYVSRLEAASSHMMQLIGNVLDMNKVRSRHFELLQQPFNLNLIVNGAMAMLQPQAKQKNLRFEVEGKEALAVTVIGDRRYFSQVLLNLLSNALKHTREGHVILRVSALSDNPDKIKLAFSVEDSGSGIAADKLSILFEPYRQVLNDTNVQLEGIGLGLAISHKLIEWMGGTLTVNSELGKGSCFRFTLEFSKAEEETVYHEALVDLHLPASLRILLVDDSDLNRFMGEAMLRNLCAKVTLAVNGEQALLYLQQQDFDVMLLDISMPVLDGLETTRWLRQQSRNQNIPVIALTAHALPEFKRQAYAAGMNGFLIKPFEYADLHREISRVLDLA